MKKPKGNSTDIRENREIKAVYLGSQDLSFKLDELKLIKKNLDETRINYEMNRLEPRDDFMLNFWKKKIFFKWKTNKLHLKLVCISVVVQ